MPVPSKRVGGALDVDVEVDMAYLGRSGRVSGKHLGCDRLGLGSGGKDESARGVEERTKLSRGGCLVTSFRR